MTKTLHYTGQAGSGFGWGVFNTYMLRELPKLCNLMHVPDPRWGIKIDGPVFLPIADHDLNPISSVRGTRNFGMCFFEFPLGPKARENAKLYDLIFCGSTWCKERLAEIGVTHTEVLIQGVDHEIFKPRHIERLVATTGREAVTTGTLKADDSFRIFSGGKFEYRKGQDIVLAAFKLLASKHPNMRLVASWQNPWPDLMVGMADSPHIKIPNCIPGAAEWWPHFWRALCEVNGIDHARVDFAPMLRHGALADLMRSTDLGVFPNRCEGGTNLVLMEYLACGKPAIASHGTGHLDIDGYWPLLGSVSDSHWVEVSPQALANVIEAAYLEKWPARDHADCTWTRAAEQIMLHI